MSIRIDTSGTTYAQERASLYAINGLHENIGDRRALLGAIEINAVFKYLGYVIFRSEFTFLEVLVL